MLCKKTHQAFAQPLTLLISSPMLCNIQNNELDFSVYNCTGNEFKCSSGQQCINAFYRCDGVFDCTDRSDERDCRKCLNANYNAKASPYFNSLSLDVLTYYFFNLFLSQLLGPQGCATMRVNSSVSQMGAASHPSGSVTVIQTVRMAVTNTTLAHLAPAPPHSSAVTMETVYYAAGFVMVTMTAGI